MMLYGVFVDSSLPASADRHVVDDMRCHRHYDEVALDEAELRTFLRACGPSTTRS